MILGFFTATSTTPGQTKDREAYRSETSGLLQAIIIVEKICKKQKILEGKIMAACDGLESTGMEIY